MKIILNQLSVSVTQTNPNLKQLAAEKLNIKLSDIASAVIYKQSLDARKKADICYKYALILDLPDALAKRLVATNKVNLYLPKKSEPVIPGDIPLKHRPIVVGAGPCGLFAAYVLAKQGLKPLLIERGQAIEKRKNHIEQLETLGLLNEDSNICFGEGGAGTFSDGKLTTRIKDPRARQVMETFVACGADERILYLAKPHLGTDGMRRVIAALRRKIESLGGEVIFGTKLISIDQENSRVCGISYLCDGKTVTLPTQVVVLATGHSAGDTYRMLKEKNVALEKKPCAIGFRIEHKREMIDKAQYGRFAPALGAAEYSLTAKHDGRGVYSFCMCPGGQVVCASSSGGQLVVNGMSYSGRDMENSNAAVVVTLDPKDTPDHPLGTLDFIEQIEKKAYNMGDPYFAPIQTAVDYVAGKKTVTLGSVTPSYKPGTVLADLNTVMPDFINQGIKAGLKQFDRQIDGFIGQGLLTGVETHTSSPVRIVRNDALESANLSGLYPAGEGAGCAGGIVSAAVDGIRIAESIIQTYHL